MTLRVIQWATGPVGRHAVAAVAAHPDLELVGAYVYDETKEGRDVGEISGIAPLGVTATRDKDAVLALEADCVLYMAQGDADPMAALADICSLLASGKNVVSTAVTPLIYPAAMGPDVVARLEKACSAGRSTFHATGIEPGWAAEVLPLAVSGLMGSVEHLLVQEIVDYASYDNAFMLFDVMGFGHAPDSTGYLAADPAVLGSVFRAPLMLLADALVAEIDAFVFDRDAWVTPEGFDVPAGRIEAGTTAALRFSATAHVHGRSAMTVEHVTRLRPDAAPDWPDGRGWRLTVQGTPSFTVEAKVAVNGEDENDQGCLATAMHAVHAIAPVVAADPGIATFLDLPLILGRHALTTLRPSDGLRTTQAPPPALVGASERGTP